METSSKWYLFAGQGFTTQKGMSSFQGQFDTMDEAKQWALDHDFVEWYQVVKATTMVVHESGWVTWDKPQARVLSPEEFTNSLNNRGILDQ